MRWVSGNLPLIRDLTLEHLYFALPPVVIGLCWRSRSAGWPTAPACRRTPTINVAGLLYTVPSLALLVLLPPILGTGILDPINVIVALTVYTVALLVRTVADALSAVPTWWSTPPPRWATARRAGSRPSSCRCRCRSSWPGCGWRRCRTSAS